MDDGAESLEESVTMLEMAAAGGTTDIVGTPHSDLSYSFQPSLIAERVLELNQALGGKIRVHHGCDFHLHFDNVQDCLAYPTKYTINHKRYLLVEFADGHIAATTDEVFKRMIYQDITPIITHPERNPLLQKRMDDLERWIQSGCLLQVTGVSFLDRFGKAARMATETLMERNMVHFVASDAHGTEDRNPVLTDAFRYVVERWGEARAKMLFSDNPRATLTGEYLDVDYPLPAKKKRWFW
jgi:protein-tyrosine phosphatase